MQGEDSEIISKLKELDSFWRPLDLPGSEAVYRALFAGAQDLTGGDRCYWIELLSMIGRAEALQNRFSESRATLKKAEEYLNELKTDCRVSSKVRWLLEKGRLHILEKTPSQARVLFSEAWTLATRSGEDALAVEIAQMLAVIEPQKVQQDWIIQAIEIAEKSPAKKAKRWLGSLYTSLGWKLYDSRQYQKALEIFERALDHLRIHEGTPREVFVAQWSIGKVLRAQGKTEEALAVQRALLSELGAGGARDGRLYEELAECLQTLRRTTEAQLYFELAYRELSSDEWITDNQPTKLKRMKDLGKVKN